jgi:hypothetical protein
LTVRRGRVEIGAGTVGSATLAEIPIGGFDGGKAVHHRQERLDLIVAEDEGHRVATSKICPARAILVLYSETVD